MARVLGWLGVLAVCVLFLRWPERLVDTDGYLHLALARLWAEQGVVTGLPWARFSALGAHYGDKELLFHWFLVPFTLLDAPERHAALALALLWTALLATLARLGMHALGKHGWLVPLLVFGSGSFMLRALRLRPELLSLLLLLWVTWFLACARYKQAALLAAAFALVHTAFHSLLGLSLVWFVWCGFCHRRWELRMLLSVWLGVAAGLCVHPQCPDNLRIFWIQNVAFWQQRTQLDVGGEFQPHGLGNLLLLDGLCAMAGLLIWRARTPVEVSPPDVPARRMAAFCWLAAVGFGSLFLRMGRFATWAVPFAVLGLVFELRARGWQVGSRVALLGDRSMPGRVLLGLGGALLAAQSIGTAFVNWQLVGALDHRESRELLALSKQLPQGARVAAAWDDAEQYAFFAPHARYLNLLDPVFMATAAPVQHSAWQRLRRGDLPDPAGELAGALDSEYIAFARTGHEALEQRLDADPRFARLHSGRHRLYRLRSGITPGFVRDWSRRDPRPPTAATELRATSGYVDARASLAADGCSVLRHRRRVEEASERLFELAAWGPSVLFVDGVQLLQLPAASEARLGQGVAFPLRWAAGDHELTVRTCVHRGDAGFYLIDRAPLVTITQSLPLDSRAASQSPQLAR
ncbi:MAG: hypothetical protein ABW321_15135 [Polyangiales bacterium]